MRRPLASVYALTTFFACPAAFAQPAGARPAAETETPLDDEPAEPLGPAQLDVLDELDELGPALPRATDRVIGAAPLRLSLLAWREEKVPSGRDQGLGLVLTFPLERLLAPSPLRPSDAPEPARLPSPPLPLRPSDDAPSPARLPSPPSPPSPTLPRPWQAFALEPDAAAPAAFERALGPASPPLAGGPPALPFVWPVALPAAVTSDALPLALPEALRVTPAQVRAVSEAALHAAGLAGPLDGRLDGLAARSRSSALLPELRVRATQSNDRALRLSYAEADP
ncbi:MAG TPA: hypothetical protein VFS00_29595, partial [Polyangiaceae bacterium]|nr:hypothetical protein [Polyangiaceae bacterium]